MAAISSELVCANLLQTHASPNQTVTFTPSCAPSRSITRLEGSEIISGASAHYHCNGAFQSAAGMNAGPVMTQLDRLSRPRPPSISLPARHVYSMPLER